MTAPRVSVHGGHSGEFCSHARDRLADILETYARQNFAWVCVTEHVPPATAAVFPQAERDAGLDAQGVVARFAGYVAECRRLQAELAGRLEVLVGFEAEVVGDYEPFVHGLLDQFEPDTFVGSVHHVHDIVIDDTPALYAEAAERSGGVTELYCDYFDAQLALIETFAPPVVGHFDLIRLLDPGADARLETPEVRACIDRNLDAIAARGLSLDCNVRAFSKGLAEPCPGRAILARALERGIAVAPGDDSHGVADVGRHVDRGADLLAELGFSTHWRKPRRRKP